MAKINAHREFDDGDPRLQEEASSDAGMNLVEFTPYQREELDELIKRALAGNLPRGRELAYWEPDKLNARHIQIIMLKAAGMKHNAIAELLDIGENNVSVVANHPDAQLILNRVLSYAAEQATDIKARIVAHGGEMLDKILEITRDPKTKKETASSNAFKLLEMGGYGAVQKSQTTVEVVVDAAHADLLGTALKESQDISAYARVNPVSMPPAG